MKTVRFFVAGRVQGVGFRWHILQRAESLALTGYVRNLSDGRVEAVARGPVEALEELERHLQHGPRFARVENVDKHEILDEINLPKGFSVQ